MPQPLLAPPPFITPSRPITIVGGVIQFHACLGSGSGYSFSLTANNSGGTITSNGLYTAGSRALYVRDTITLTDSQGVTSDLDVRVVPAYTDGVQEGYSTLAGLRNECKRRTDLVNSTFISDPEWNGYINQSANELYDRLISAYGNDYNVAPPFIFQTDGVNERYMLPPDFYKLLGVDVQVSNTVNGWMLVQHFNYGDRSRVASPYQTYAGLRSGFKYRLSGDNMWFMPSPAGGQYIQLLYVPRMTMLVRDTDVLDGVSGWEEYAIADVCVKAKNKREEDVSVFAAQKEAQGGRIDSIAESRDAAAPGTVVDARSMEEWDMRSWYWGGR